MQTFTRACLPFLLLLPCLLPAQNFQPVYRGETYEFMSTGGYTAVIRVDSVTWNGTDSVYHFPCGLDQEDYSWIFQFCYTWSFPSLEIDDGLFGKHMLKHAGGDYMFTGDASTDTFLIRTSPAVTAPWVFHAAQGITAQITQRSYQTLPNLQVPDSVLTISFSNGKTMMLSEHYGFIESWNFGNEGDSLDFYSDLMPAALSLSGIRERGLGVLKPGFDEIFDFDPGDRFDLDNEMFMNFHHYYSWKVLSADINPHPDTIHYVMERRSYSAGSPAPIVHPTDTVAWRFARQDYDFFTYPTWGFDYTDWSLMRRFMSSQHFTWHPELEFTGTYVYDSCYHILDVVIDMGRSENYAAGLGLVFRSNPGFYQHEEHMLCYVKANDSAGSCIDWSTIIARAEAAELQARLHLYPNPAQEQVHITWTGDPGPEVRVELRDLRGALLRQSYTVGMEADLDLNGLAAGVYLVQVAGAKGVSRTERLCIQ